MDEEVYEKLTTLPKTVADVLNIDVSEKMKTELSKYPLDWYVFILEKLDKNGIGVISPENYNNYMNNLDKSIHCWSPIL